MRTADEGVGMWRGLAVSAMVLAWALWPAVAGAASPTPGIWSITGAGPTRATMIVTPGMTIDNFHGGFAKPDPLDQFAVEGHCGVTTGPPVNGVPIGAGGAFAIRTLTAGTQGLPQFSLDGSFVTATEATGTYRFTYDCGTPGPGPTVQQFTARLIDATSPSPPPGPPAPATAPPPPPPPPRLSVPASGRVKICATILRGATFRASSGRATKQSCTPTASLSGRRLAAVTGSSAPPVLAACGAQGAQRVEGRGAWCRNVQLALVAVVSGERPRRVSLGTLNVTERVDDGGAAGAVRVRRWATQHAWLPAVSRSSLSTQITVRCRRSDRRSCATTTRSARAPTSGLARAVSAPLKLARVAPGRRLTATVSTRLRFTIGGLPSLKALQGQLVSAAVRGSAATWVFPRFTPTADFSLMRLPASVTHMSVAQAAGLPGAPGTQALSRVTGPAVQRNRRAACGAVQRQWNAEGFACAVYPFVSTRQGAAGAHIAKIPLAEDRIHGRVLSSFYRNQQILAGDRFYVAPTP